MTIAEKNRAIKKELKATYPEVKFSVTKRWYDTSNITWEDGPTEKSVKETLDTYCEIWTSRTISEEIEAITTSYVKSHYSGLNADYEVYDVVSTIQNKYYISSETYSIDWIRQEVEIEEMVKEEEYQKWLIQREIDVARDKRFSNRRKLTRDKFDTCNTEVADIENEDTIVVSRFANLNKNNTLARYESEVQKGDYYLSNCVVKRTVKFNDSFAWTYFKNNLMERYDFCENFGGSKLLESDPRTNEFEEFDFFSEGELMDYFKANNYSIVIEVSYQNEKIYVNPEGYSYPRYVAI
jgi:hypothetical protein